MSTTATSAFPFLLDPADGFFDRLLDAFPRLLKKFPMLLNKSPNRLYPLGAVNRTG
jgi:hypothetical protein